MLIYDSLDKFPCAALGGARVRRSGGLRSATKSTNGSGPAGGGGGMSEALKSIMILRKTWDRIYYAAFSLPPNVARTVSYNCNSVALLNTEWLLSFARSLSLLFVSFPALELLLESLDLRKKHVTKHH